MTAWVMGLAGALVLAALGFFLIYNRLVALRNTLRNAWAQIDVQLKRRQAALRVAGAHGRRAAGPDHPAQL